MRLNKIKIAGFKSFVDPTTIDLRSNLTGIVGPNGCGKSNTIDAVRWVMGESSAKHLRGASMDDVIFNGSSARKPIGQASIELLFDNADHSLGGEYARFTEIGIKRQISRDGQSKYFLNGSRCRRRDITDIFLGTGLGPRSYAIIEQGMISRLIEAKPEELRNTLEEAAGISKYKERRRETENRIRHTRENLDRLSDLREELEKQLAHLDRQAKAAERFKKLKSEERRLNAELLLLRLLQVRKDKVRKLDTINQTANRHQAELAEQRSLENRIESERSGQVEANENVNKIQADFYQISAEISRIEQTIQHQKELETRFQRELEQLEEELTSASQHALDDQQQLDSAKSQIAQLEPEFKQHQEALHQAEQAQMNAEQQLADWQQHWNELQQKIADPTRQAQVERARMDQLESELQHITDRLSRLQKDQGVFNTDAYRQELTDQETALQGVQEKHAQAKQQLQQQQQQMESEQQHIRELQETLEKDRSTLQSLTGRLASLEALQQAGLGNGSGGKLKKQFNAWLKRHQLDQQPRLAESIEVQSGWEKALETVLGNDLEALSLDDAMYRNLLESFNDIPPVSASFFLAEDNMALPDATYSPDSLAAKVSRPAALKSLLAPIICVEDLENAISRQATLKPGEMLITRDGLQLGRNWLRQTGKSESNQREGVLARQKEIEQVQQQLNGVQQSIVTQQQQLETGQNQLKSLEESRGDAQNKLNELYREESRIQSQIEASRNRITQTEANQKRIESEIEELATRRQEAQQAHQSATRLRNQALAQMETLEKEKTASQAGQAPLQDALNQTRQTAQELRNRLQTVQLQLESHKQTRDNTRLQLERFTARKNHLEARKHQLIEQRSGESFEDPEKLAQRLEMQLSQRKQVDDELGTARQNLQAIDSRIRELEKNRHHAEQAVDKFRNQLESLKLELQEVTVREQTLKERLDETDFDEDLLIRELPEDASLKTHQQTLEQVQSRISRLGAINLAAIDEFKTQSERKVYLDQQNDDLEEALDTLESAIAKIDRDTRSLFKETFEKVNLRIQEMFPQLFGGGKAHLEMTGDDLLTTGISIMAQPPGKRISSIHLMSGGEKALTAVAMVFAIFELNPAPFCMLDEVDAPLDEANVGRFCDLVRKMSERVQFIFITHNKTTMELANNLVGVTMREPGVSRLVSVDVNEAARMAQE